MKTACVKVISMYFRFTLMALGAIMFLLASSAEPFDFKFFFLLIALSVVLILVANPRKAVKQYDVYTRYLIITGRKHVKD